MRASATAAEFAELVLDELVEDLSREVCFPLHRALHGRSSCLSCGGAPADADGGGWDAPLVGNDEFERNLIAAMQLRAAELAERAISREPGLDVFGAKPKTVAVDSFKCSHCGKKVAASRYAKHLEGCMLGGGRLSARIADSAQAGRDPSPVAKRARQADARASPQPAGDGLAEPALAEPLSFIAS